jgi:hypothetical protein
MSEAGGAAKKKETHQVLPGEDFQQRDETVAISQVLE